MVCLSVILLCYRMTHLWFCNKRICNKKGALFVPDPVYFHERPIFYITYQILWNIYFVPYVYTCVCVCVCECIYLGCSHSPSPNGTSDTSIYAPAWRKQKITIVSIPCDSRTLSPFLLCRLLFVLINKFCLSRFRHIEVWKKLLFLTSWQHHNT